MNDAAIFCARCAQELQPGAGDFYIVRILAVADPTGPNFTEEDLERDWDAELQRLYDELEGLSAREAVEQVYRRMTIHLCQACYRDWIEDPAR